MNYGDDFGDDIGDGHGDDLGEQQGVQCAWPVLEVCFCNSTYVGNCVLSYIGSCDSGRVNTSTIDF